MAAVILSGILHPENLDSIVSASENPHRNCKLFEAYRADWQAGSFSVMLHVAQTNGVYMKIYLDTM